MVGVVVVVVFVVNATAAAVAFMLSSYKSGYDAHRLQRVCHVCGYKTKI